MDGIEKYNYIYKEKKILIETGKKRDSTGEMVYFAKSNHRNIFALAECKETALEKCVKRIKFSISLAEKNIVIMKQEQGINLAKRYYEEHMKDKKSFQDNIKYLSYGVYVEDEVLTLSVFLSSNNELPSNNELLSVDKKMEVIAIVYVNLVTGECDLIEKRFK